MRAARAGGVLRGRRGVVAACARARPSGSGDTGKKTFFCFGAGYTGLGLACALQGDFVVHATTRSPAKQDLLRSCGIVPHLFDPSSGLKLSEEGEEALRSSTAVLSTIPPSTVVGPPHGVDPTAELIREVFSATRGSSLSSSSPPPEGLDWVGYVSTTGVYGERRGEWVTEETPVGSNPVSDRASARIRAEAEWLALPGELPVHIFRCGGIYGPHRNVLRTESKPENVRRRRNQQLVSRCHVLDVVQGLLKSMEAPNSGGIYNIVDDDPAPRDAVEAFALGLVGRPRPTEVVPSSSRQATKRVSNARLKGELGVVLRHPTYKEGMRAIVEGDIRPFTREVLDELIKIK
ncbi:NAD(P)-binding protein [Chloropicon primus]|uniref:NAD(P)-binding protein n=2 Tax=Chloropicon primus TaxID=1764295 RepID=A0A5B8MDV7_9CHLO|nr:NAD(P)-binding protein [Chloropicon primus]UPQ97041.1 NAD(P)-binding protein [Chloropicon primus]|eukprot:QDZ17825.1 NAD(P)-binding protein [Chloropicon primus]